MQAGQRRDRRGRAVTWLQAPREPEAYGHRTGRGPQTGATGAKGMDAGFSRPRWRVRRTPDHAPDPDHGTSMAPGGAAREGTAVLQRVGQPGVGRGARRADRRGVPQGPMGVTPLASGVRAGRSTVGARAAGSERASGPVSMVAADATGAGAVAGSGPGVAGTSGAG